MVKNLSVMQETRVRSLSWEDALEEGMASHFSPLPCRIPWTEEPGRVQSIGPHGVRLDRSQGASPAWPMSSAVIGTQPHGSMCPFSPKPRSHPGRHATLGGVPCAEQRVLGGCAFKCSRVSIPGSLTVPSLPLPQTPPAHTLKFVLQESLPFVSQFICITSS